MRRGRRRRLARLVSTRETTDRAKNGVPHHQSGSVFTAKREISDESPRFAVQSPVSRGLHLPDHATRVPCAEDSTALGASQRRGPIRSLPGNWIGRIGRVRRAPVRARRGRHEKRSRGLRVFRPRARRPTRTRGARERALSVTHAATLPGSVEALLRASRSVRARVASPSASRPPARRASRVSSRSRCRSASSPTTSSSDERRLRHREPRRGRPRPRRDSSATRATRRRPNGAATPVEPTRGPPGGPVFFFPIVRPEPPLPSSVRTT